MLVLIFILMMSLVIWMFLQRQSTKEMFLCLISPKDIIFPLLVSLAEDIEVIIVT